MTGDPWEGRTLTRREHLEFTTMLRVPDLFAAREAVASVALAHPEWDMDERRTWEGWEAAER